MASSFRLRTGATADVMELEYLSALHQTCIPFLRSNGTISSIDIMRFLKSRANLNVSHEDCIIRLVRGLGGGIVGDDVIQTILQEEQELLLSSLEKKGKQQRKKKQTLAGSSLVSSKAHAIRNDAQEEQEISHGEPFSIEGQMESPSEKKHQGSLFHRRKKQDEDTAENDQQNDNRAIIDTQDNDEEDPAQDVTANDLEAEEFLDLVQITAILLMPTLARAGKLWKDSQLPPTLHVQEPPPADFRGIKGFITKIIDRYKKREEEKDQALRTSLNPPNIIPDVLSSMVKAVGAGTDDDTFPVLNATLVKNLLISCGEYERAADRVLVDKMVEAAASSSGLLDEEAFVNALTNDLSLWKVGCEDDKTTSFFDVYGFESYREMDIVERQQKQAAEEAAELQRRDASKHRLSREGLSTQSAVPDDSIAGSSNNADDETVEDDIVPYIVGLPHRDPQQNLSPDASACAMSVITMDSMVDHAKSEYPEQDENDSKVYNLVDHAKSEHLEQDENDGKAYNLDRTATPLDIDFAIDMHSSVTLTVLIFFFFILTALVYAALVLQIPELSPSCGRTFGCTLVSKIILWAIFAVILAGAGYLVIIPLSLGNQPSERAPRRLALAFILGLLITWIPFLAIEKYEQTLEPPYSGPANSVTDPNYRASQWACRFLGTLTCLGILWQFLLSIIGNQRIRQNDFLRKCFSASAICGSARQKKAATRKINTMLENAQKLHPRSESGFSGVPTKDEAMTNYVLRGEKFEETGGLWWTWKRLLLGQLFSEDGIWIMTRLIIIQTVQFVLLVFYGYSGVLLVQQVTEQAQKFQDTLRPGYPEWVYTFVPTPQQVQRALYPAVGVSVFIMITIFLVYIPSYVRTIFEFRSGVRPSLKSREFRKYRIAVDAVYTNIGNAVFGMIGTAFIFFGLVGLFLFLFIWPFSRNFMILLVAWALGLTITIVLKQIIVRHCRRRFYSGFFRTNPNRANLTSLALECWFIGMGGGVLVGRFTQFILAACFFVGRTDVAFLSQDVALFGYAFDYVPTNYVKDILVHEAHRHPYMERLFAIYLMKIKNNSFGSEAGACWRQLFVTCLMPWMMKLRCFTDKRLEAMSLEEYNTRRLERMSTSQAPSLVDSVSRKKSRRERKTPKRAKERKRSSSL